MFGHRRRGSSHGVGYRRSARGEARWTRTPRTTAPTPGLGAGARTPRTSAALPDPTTFIASANRSSRLARTVTPCPSVSSHSTARVEPRLGSAETASAALREKLVPMRDTPDRQLQLDFQRRVPEPCTDCSNLTARASFALHDARLTSATGGPGRCRRFLPNHTWLRSPLMSRSRYPGGA